MMGKKCEVAMDYRAIAKGLLQEHPQTIAVALTRLEPEQAGEILKLLPAFIQADLVTRIAQIDQLPTEVVEEIDGLLDRLFQRR
jgi:flagellar motor switch protein FliG